MKTIMPSEIFDAVESHVQNNAVINETDTGIGHYECHGHTGNQSLKCLELESCPDLTIFVRACDIPGFLPEEHDCRDAILNEIDCSTIEVEHDSDMTLTVHVESDATLDETRCLVSLTFSFS